MNKKEYLKNNLIENVINIDYHEENYLDLIEILNETDLFKPVETKKLTIYSLDDSKLNLIEKNNDVEMSIIDYLVIYNSDKLTDMGINFKDVLNYYQKNSDNDTFYLKYRNYIIPSLIKDIQTNIDRKTNVNKKTSFLIKLLNLNIDLKLNDVDLFENNKILPYYYIFINSNIINNEKINNYLIDNKIKNELMDNHLYDGNFEKVLFGNNVKPETILKLMNNQKFNIGISDFKIKLNNFNRAILKNDMLYNEYKHNNQDEIQYVELFEKNEKPIKNKNGYQLHLIKIGQYKFKTEEVNNEIIINFLKKFNFHFNDNYKDLSFLSNNNLKTENIISYIYDKNIKQFFNIDLMLNLIDKIENKNHKEMAFVFYLNNIIFGSVNIVNTTKNYTKKMNIDNIFSILDMSIKINNSSNNEYDFNFKNLTSLNLLLTSYIKELYNKNDDKNFKIEFNSIINYLIKNDFDLNKVQRFKFDNLNYSLTNTHYKSKRSENEFKIYSLKKYAKYLDDNNINQIINKFKSGGKIFEFFINGFYVKHPEYNQIDNQNIHSIVYLDAPIIEKIINLNREKFTLNKFIEQSAIISCDKLINPLKMKHYNKLNLNNHLIYHNIIKNIYDSNFDKILNKENISRYENNFFDRISSLYIIAIQNANFDFLSSEMLYKYIEENINKNNNVEVLLLPLISINKFNYSKKHVAQFLSSEHCKEICKVLSFIDKEKINDFIITKIRDSIKSKNALDFFVNLKEIGNQMILKNECNNIQIDKMTNNILFLEQNIFNINNSTKIIKKKIGNI